MGGQPAVAQRSWKQPRGHSGCLTTAACPLPLQSTEQDVHAGAGLEKALWALPVSLAQGERSAHAWGITSATEEGCEGGPEATPGCLFWASTSQPTWRLSVYCCCLRMGVSGAVSSKF